MANVMKSKRRQKKIMQYGKAKKRKKVTKKVSLDFFSAARKRDLMKVVHPKLSKKVLVKI